jgi:hypothetical protein
MLRYLTLPAVDITTCLQVPDTHRPHSFVFSKEGPEVVMNYKHFACSEHADNKTNPGWWNSEPIPVFHRIPQLCELQPRELKADVTFALEVCNVLVAKHAGGCGDKSCRICLAGVPHGCGSETCPRCSVFACFVDDDNWSASSYITPAHIQEWTKR